MVNCEETYTESQPIRAKNVETAVCQRDGHTYSPPQWRDQPKRSILHEAAIRVIV